jgi:hypothetical protein
MERKCKFVRFQVLTTVSMEIRASWDVAPCSLVGVDRRFRGPTVSIIMAITHL